jgi:hypothetical protein
MSVVSYIDTTHNYRNLPVINTCASELKLQIWPLFTVDNPATILMREGPNLISFDLDSALFVSKKLFELYACYVTNLTRLEVYQEEIQDWVEDSWNFVLKKGVYESNFMLAPGSGLKKDFKDFAIDKTKSEDIIGLVFDDRRI